MSFLRSFLESDRTIDCLIQDRGLNVNKAEFWSISTWSEHQREYRHSVKPRPVKPVKPRPVKPVKPRPVKPVNSLRNM